MWSLINPSLAPKLVVSRVDLLGNAGESVVLLSSSSEEVRLADDSDGCMVGEGVNPGIPNTSNDASSSLDSVAGTVGHELKQQDVDNDLLNMLK